MRTATPCCHSRATKYPNASSVAIPRKTEMVRTLEARSARRVIRSDFIGSLHARGSIGRLPDAMESRLPERVEDPFGCARTPDFAQSRPASARTQACCRDRHGRPAADRLQWYARGRPGPGKSRAESAFFAEVDSTTSDDRFP